MVMPSSQYLAPILGNRPKDTPEFRRVKAVTFRNRNLRFQPNLGIAAMAFDMDVWSLSRQTFIREKEKT
jgi:hypothetical protein